MTLFEAVRVIELGVFATLAAVSLVQWRRLRSEGAAWLALTFTVFAGAVLVGRMLPDTASRNPADEVVVRAVIAALGLFPFCLFRFAASFTARAPRREAAVGLLCGLLMLATVTMPYVPDRAEALPLWFAVYTVVFVVHWTLLSTLSVACLWRAGRGQPAVIGRRMRMLGLAAVALNAVLVLGAAGGPRSSQVDVVRDVGILASAVLFLVAFAPPRSLRTVWRRQELERLRLAEADLMLADTTGAVVGIVLPRAVRLLGAGSAVLTDHEGRVIGRHGIGEAAAAGVADRLSAHPASAPVLESDLVAIRIRSGWLALQTTAAMPFFGRDELVLLETLGHLTGLALDRADLVRRDRAAGEVLAEREAQLAEAQRTAQLGSYRWELGTGAVTWSDELYRLLDLVPGEVTDHFAAFASRLHPEDAAAVREASVAVRRATAPSALEYRIVRADGVVRWIHGRFEPVVGDDGIAVRVVGTLQDITERKQSEEAIAFQALHDSLTGLANRRLFLDRLSHALAVRARRPAGLAVLFLDVDRFKWLNDSLGHAAGDELLVAVARRLQASLRPGDTVARFGGDEFVILCEELAGEPAAERLAVRFASELARPVVVAGEETIVTVSIGIAWSPPGRAEDTADTLLRDADAAMYQAKDRGRDRYELFDAGTRLAAVARHETANALRRGMERGELVVHYQPQVDITTGRVVGVEALVRWRHPERGLLVPDEFVPLAEETGLIVPLGVLVIAEACRQVQAWRRQDGHGPGIALSVNLSARQLMAPDLCEVVEAALASSGLDPSLLCLEITESVLLEDAAASARVLHRLKGLGVTIGVDDFGTGFSSLTYLKRFPVDILKIDRSFVEGLGRNREDRAIVASVVDLAHAFGLTTIAEGVETITQLAELRNIGCEQGQGYLWSRPLPPADASQWITAHSGPAEPVPPRRLSLVPGSPPRRRHRILIVDDDRSARRLLRVLFETDDDFEVVGEADDGREAIALARHFSPDLVLLDLAMPGMGGLEALPLILAVAPGAKVAVLSGLDASDVAESAARQGAAAYFPKGSDPDRLPALLGPLLATA